MDLTTHLLVGVAISIIATNNLDENTLLIYTTALSSSILPDLDTLSKIKGNAFYISSHRRTTHLLVNIPFLSLIIPLILKLIINDTNFLSLYLISLGASLLHILLDILNSYPTEIRSIGKNIKLSIIDTFDVILTLILIIGIIVSIFSLIYLYAVILLAISYILLRVIIFHIVKRKLHKRYLSKTVVLIPQKNSIKWRYIIDFNRYYLIGTYSFSFKTQKIIKKRMIPNDLLLMIKRNSCYQSFMKISNAYIYHEINEQTFELIDLKYYQKNFFYFRALFSFRNGRITNSYIGWNFSKNTFSKKLEGKKNELI